MREACCGVRNVGGDLWPGGPLGRVFAAFCRDGASPCEVLERTGMPMGRFWAGKVSRPHSVACVSGRVWVTAPSLPGDHILRPGQRIFIPGPGVTMVNAVEPGAGFRLVLRS